MKYFCGLDLGQSSDYTALVIAERIPAEQKPLYHLRHIQRFKLGTPYPEIVESVKTLTLTPALQHEAVLAIDATGVGAPVVDMFTAAELPCPLYPISIHGGDRVTYEGQYRVPKRDLVSVVQVLLQGSRLKIAEGLPETKTLVRELLNFKVKIDPQTAHDSYSAWRENIHDDLVLAVALACWLAETVLVDVPSVSPLFEEFVKESAWRVG